MKNHQKLVLEASAGSGKTYSLALRYVYLLFQGAKIGEILTLTFTNKAAQEMQERIANFLSTLGDLEAPKAERDKLIESLVKDYGLCQEEILTKAPKILEDFYTQAHKITTIDAFLNFILKRFCWYVGVPYEFRVEPLQDTKIYEDFLLSLNQEQKNYFLQMCLQSDKNPLAMLENLNTFFKNHFDCLLELKWEVGDLEFLHQEAMRLAHLIKQSVEGDSRSSPSAIKAVEFESIEALSDKTWVEKGSEYHYFKKLKLPQKDFDDLLCVLIQYHRSKDAQYLRFLQDFYESFQKSKDNQMRLSNTLHFQDIMQKSFELLCQSRLDRDFFYFRLDDRISHILLDEFQDTSVVQYKLLLPLIEEILSGSGRIKDRSFFVVGDPKQSIYRFRGGFGQLMQEIGNQLSLNAENLDKNYRSQKQIVEFVNAVFSQVYVQGEANQLTYTQSHSQAVDGGYVKIYDVFDVREADSIEAVESYNQHILQILEEMLKSGIALQDIVILAFRNQDIASLGEVLKERFSNILTEDSLSLGEKKEAQVIKNALQCSLLQEDRQRAFYQANLCKLLGKKLEDKVEILPYGGHVGEYVYQALKTYGLGGLIAQKVLQIACESKDVGEFLTRLENVEGKEAQEEQTGLRLMTIHKSKGLEFKHVLVLDRLSTSHQRDLFFCNYTFCEGSYQGEIYMKNSFLAKCDPFYIQASQKQEEYIQQERKNLLYVAFTRAKESLWIAPILRKRGGKSEFEVVGLVEEERNVFPQEWGELPKNPQIHPLQEGLKPPLKTLLVCQRDYGRQEDFIAKAYGGYQPNHIQSIKRGEAFHKGLEMYLGYQSSLQEVRAFLNNLYGFYLKDLEAILESIQKAKQMLEQRFGYTSLQSEVGFMQENKLYRMDCLLFVGEIQGDLQEIVVLDYKSGKKREAYEEQITHYVKYVKSQYPQVEVSGYLMYLDEDLRLERTI